MCRRCGELDRRGPASNRRAQKRWLLTTFGDGATCSCFWCESPLTFSTLQRDRITPGGPYRRDNLVPSCGPCNIRRSAASIPDGCEYGPVDDLSTEDNGRYPAEFSRKLAADLTKPTPDPLRPSRPERTPEPTHVAGVDSSRWASEARSSMRFPRPRRSAYRVAQTPDHPARPAGLDLLVRAEHDRSIHEPVTHEVDPDPDLVVIDTTNLEELRAKHPWLFTDEADASDATLRRIDADARAAETALNTQDDQQIRHDNAQHERSDDAADRDADYGR